jgi:hypothetical protein
MRDQAGAEHGEQLCPVRPPLLAKPPVPGPLGGRKGRVFGHSANTMITKPECGQAAALLQALLATDRS